MESRLCEGGPIIDYDPEAELSPGRASALWAVAVASLLLALLPAAIGLAIFLRTTVSLEFGASAFIAIAGGIKLAAGVSGLLSAFREPRQAPRLVSNL